jgi:hypothetical protein
MWKGIVADGFMAWWQDKQANRHGRKLHCFFEPESPQKRGENTT